MKLCVDIQRAYLCSSAVQNGDRCRKDADELDVHLPLLLPQGKLLHGFFPDPLFKPDELCN